MLKFNKQMGIKCLKQGIINYNLYQHDLLQ